MSTIRQFILLTGIPGSGKSVVGECLRDEHKFDFFPTDPNFSLTDPYRNMSEFRREVELGVGDFVERWHKRHGEQVCVEWGFQPLGINKFGKSFLDEIRSFKAQRAKIFWLTCDKDIAYLNWLNSPKNKNYNPACWGQQVCRIESVGLPTPDFIVIQTHPNRKPKSPEDLAQEILFNSTLAR